MNVIYFKMSLVKSMIGPKLDGVPDAISDHKLMCSK